MNSIGSALSASDAAQTDKQVARPKLFLYRHVLDRKLGQLETVIRARKSKRLPVVLTRDEVRAVFNELHGRAASHRYLKVRHGHALAEGFTIAG